MSEKEREIAFRTKHIHKLDQYLQFLFVFFSVFLLDLPASYAYQNISRQGKGQANTELSVKKYHITVHVDFGQAPSIESLV